MGVVVGLVVTFLMVVWPWVALASVGGFDQAAWQAIGQSKPAWLVAVLLVPPAAIVYWLLVRPQLRAVAQVKPAGGPLGGGPGRE
jgi:hypothetical protein